MEGGLIFLVSQFENVRESIFKIMIHIKVKVEKSNVIFSIQNANQFFVGSRPPATAITLVIPSQWI